LWSEDQIAITHREHTKTVIWLRNKVINIYARKNYGENQCIYIQYSGVIWMSSETTSLIRSTIRLM